MVTSAHTGKKSSAADCADRYCRERGDPRGRRWDNNSDHILTAKPHARDRPSLVRPSFPAETRQSASGTQHLCVGIKQTKPAQLTDCPGRYLSSLGSGTSQSQNSSCSCSRYISELNWGSRK